MTSWSSGWCHRPDARAARDRTPLTRLARWRSWPQGGLHGGPGRAEAEARVELLGAVLVVGGDPQVAHVAGRRDRGARHRRAAPAAPVVRMDEDLADLRRVAGALELGEG